MIETIAGELGVSQSVVWLLIAAVFLQVAVQITALIDLARRPRVRFDMKWVWALIILVLGNSFIGPILYVAFGRSVPEQVDTAASSTGSTDAAQRTRHAVDTLYGSGEEK